MRFSISEKRLDLARQRMVRSCVKVEDLGEENFWEREE